MILRIKEIWDDWAIYDEDGFGCGIKDDAPDEVKKAYYNFLKKERENQKIILNCKKHSSVMFV